MEPICDLHIHSTFSDGTDTPTQLIDLASAAGLSAVALCDHNTVAGLPELIAAAQGREVEAVPGVEFSTEYLGTELHILGLFIRPEHYGAVTEVLDAMLLRKEQSNRALVEALKKADIHVDYTAIKAHASGNVNRALIAAEMVRLGYCGSVKEAFSKWLSPKRGYYQPPKRLDAFEAIRFIKSIGATAVLAHPFLNLDEEALRVFLKTAKECGLDAIEAHYSMFTPAQTALARQIAEEFDLKISGGSDYHGSNKPHIQIGKGQGDLRVSMELLEQLRPV